MTIRHLFCLAMAAGTLAAAPQEAQRLASNCKRERVRPEWEQRDRRRPAELALDSVKAEIRKEIEREARAAARAAGVEAPEGIFLVLYEPGKPEETGFRAWRSNVPPPVLQEVLERSLPRLAALPEREPARLDVRLDSVAPAVDSTATHMVECVPELANRDEVSRLIQMFAGQSGDLLSGSRPRRSTVVLMLLSREGEVAYTEVQRSSGEPRLDAYAISLVDRMRFRPAAINGQNVDAWITLPVTLQAHDPRRQGPPGRAPFPAP